MVSLEVSGLVVIVPFYGLRSNPTRHRLITIYGSYEDHGIHQENAWFGRFLQQQCVVYTLRIK